MRLVDVTCMQHYPFKARELLFVSVEYCRERVRLSWEG